jgi:hypothetical protein
MRRGSRPLAVLLALGTAFTLTPKVSFACAGFCPGGPPSSFEQFLDKTQYAPGARIGINLTQRHECGILQASSEGFAAAANLTEKPVNDGFTLTGVAKAITTPGTYRATIRCRSNQFFNQFTIKAGPAAPPPGNPKPKPPIVKPIGAADTGGGSAARGDPRR